MIVDNALNTYLKAKKIEYLKSTKRIYCHLEFYSHINTCKVMKTCHRPKCINVSMLNQYMLPLSANSLLMTPSCNQNLENFVTDYHLVNISTICSTVFTRRRLISSFKTFFQIKWWCASICFVWAWNNIISIAKTNYLA